MSLFVTVLEEGSFTAAARRLEFSKSYVSKSISNLEEQLGVRLLRRTTRRLYLTEEGQRFLTLCQEVVETAEQGWKAMQSRGVQVAGHLRISAPITYGQIFLPPVIERFCQRYPRVKVDLVLENRAVDLVKENFDLAFRITDYPPENQGLVSLGMMHDVVCAAPAYLDSVEPITNPKQLAQLRCLLYLNPQRVTQWTFRKKGTLETVSVDGQLAFSHHGALLKSLLAGQGIAKLPEYFVREHLENGRLKGVLPEFHCGSIPIYLVHQLSKELPPRVTEFVSMVANSR